MIAIPFEQLKEFVDSLLQCLFEMKASRIKNIIEAVLILRFFPKLRFKNPLSHDLSTLLIGLKYFENAATIFNSHLL